MGTQGAYPIVWDGWMGLAIVYVHSKEAGYLSFRFLYQVVLNAIMDVKESYRFSALLGWYTSLKSQLAILELDSL